MFKMPSLTVKARLIGITGALLLMLLASTWVGLSGLSRADENIGRLYDGGLVPLSLTDEVARGSLSNFETLGEAAYRIGDKTAVAQKLDELARRVESVDGLIEKLKNQSVSSDVGEQIKAFVKSRGDLQSSMASVRTALAAGDADANQLLYTGVLPVTRSMQSALDKLVAVQVADGGKLYQAAREDHARISKMSMEGLVVVFALGVLMTILTIRSILSALRRAVQVADGIAEGHLGHEIVTDGKGELGRLLNSLRAMDGRLCGIVGEVRRGSDEVSVAAQQISRGNDDLSQRTQEQASSLEETAASMEEMTSTVKQNAENASQANQLVLSAREQAEHGGEVAEQAVRAMSEIDASSRKIAEIVGLINEIAFQTNLLSLNAAVEAARAGEQGRGFAVVASEVRSLAQRCATAAKEIKTLIGESEVKVRAGTELVEKAGATLVEIVGSVKKVADIVGEIAAASQEQSIGIEQVNKAVMQMDEVTQQNAALVEESAAAAHALEEQAGGLTRQVSFFHIRGHGSVSDEVNAVLSRAAKGAPTPVTNAMVVEKERAIAGAGRAVPVVATEACGTPEKGEWQEF